MGREGVAEEAGFSRLYGRLRGSPTAQLGEPPVRYGRAAYNVREEIVRCIWFGGQFSAEGLTTDDGRRIEVVSPGWWNVEGGPDFARAEIVLEGAGRLVGDVEVHTLASGWYAHKHHEQADYNSVILHVALWNDRDEATVTRQDGASAPQLTLSRAVGDEMEELVEVIGPDDEQVCPEWPLVPGRYCHDAHAEGRIDGDWLGRLLDAAGDHRVLTRADSFAGLLSDHSPDQLLYERIAESLGYKNNRMAFMQLAGLLPARVLRGAVASEADLAVRRTALEAAYFVVGGLMPDADGRSADAETESYCRTLGEAWQQMGPIPVPASLSPQHWRLAGTRPQNYPGRRVAALAGLVAEWLHEGLFRHFLAAAKAPRPGRRTRPGVALRKALVDPIVAIRHPYWSRRYTFGGSRTRRPVALVGAERATVILVDVLLPMLLGHAQVERDLELARPLYELWHAMPRRPDNAVTRRMAQTMFGDAAEARRIVSSARRQQGLHQIYRDFCSSDQGCGCCVVYLAHQAGNRLTDPAVP
jgi:hypothetical protein